MSNRLYDKDSICDSDNKSVNKIPEHELRISVRNIMKKRLRSKFVHHISIDMSELFVLDRMLLLC